MKKLFYLVLLLAFTYSYCQVVPEKSIDNKLVGIFKGTEVDGQVKGLTKNWIVNRFQNGDYVIMFTTIAGCKVESFVEKGIWWIENGKYYELFSNSDEPSIYDYQVSDNGNIGFKVKSSDVKYESKEYEFFDIKLD